FPPRRFSDLEALRWSAADFYSFGLGEVYPLSSINGSGTGELLDDLVVALPQAETTTDVEVQEEEQTDDTVRVAIIGRPNVGKSSLANLLLGEDRSIVADEGGTTRDTVDSTLRYHGRDVVLVDTAGLRRRSRITEDIEFYSMMRTE